MYIGATNVEAYNPMRSPFGATTRPSTNQVTELILEAEADVTASLESGGYTVPIATSATQAFKLVQAACAKCAAALVEAVAPNADPKRIDHYQRMCDSAKAMIEAGNLPGLTQDAGGFGSVRSGFSGATPAFFSREMQL